MPYLKYDGTPVAQTAAPVANFYGTDARDVLTGTNLAESFWGGQGDLMTGGGGDDTYYLKAASDTVVELPGGGTDTVHAWTSIYLGNFANVENATVGGDNTYAAGNAGDNLIKGEAGSQQLYGGGGQDVLVGGAGRDTFIVYKGEGNDAIADFSVGEDVLRLKAGFSTFEQVQARFVQVGADTRIDLGDGDALVLRNVQANWLKADNFQLEIDYTKLGAMTFADEFSGPLSIWDAEDNPGGVWRPDFGYQGSQGTGSYTLMSNDEKQIYTSPYFRGHAGDFSESPFVSNADGTLSIWAKPSANTEIFGYGYTSGMITTKQSFAQTYGYFEMKADIPDAAGAWPAFWLIPVDGSWPPELDVMEALTSDPRGAWTTEHSSVGGHKANGQLSFVPDTASGMHTYGALWTPTDIVWYIDGVEVFRQGTPADMHKPMFMIANLALGGWGGAIDRADLPAEFKIDYIRAYQLDGLTTTTPVVPPPVNVATPPPPPPAPIIAGPADGGMVLTATSPGVVLTGGAGADTLNASQGPDQLTGGAGSDVFAFRALPWSAGHITDFQVGVDRLDVSTLYVGGYEGTDPVADGYVRFESDGAGGTKVMLDPDAGALAHPWSWQIVILDGVAPTGLTAAQVFGGAPAGNLPPTINPFEPPGPGVTEDVAPIGPTYQNALFTLLKSAAPTKTLIGGAKKDNLIGTSGDDLLDGKGNADVMRGGSGDDTYLVDRPDDTIVEAENGGIDTVHSTSGAYVLPDHVENLRLVGTYAQSGTGNGLDNLLTSNDAGSTLSGGAGNDILVAGRGADVLSGGEGQDIFVFDRIPTQAGRITDFEFGKDILDLRGLFNGANYRGSDPIMDKMLEFRTDGQGGTGVYFDADGAGSAAPWVLITSVQNTAPGSFAMQNDWFFT